MEFIKLFIKSLAFFFEVIGPTNTFRQTIQSETFWTKPIYFYYLKKQLSLMTKNYEPLSLMRIWYVYNIYDLLKYQTKIV